MIEIKNLVKKFDDYTALNDMSIKINNSSVFGIVGYNGAGKTTLIKTIMGVYLPDSGDVLVDGVSVYNNPEIKQKMFYVPDDIYFPLAANLKKMGAYYKNFYPDFSMEVLEKLAQLFKLDMKKSIAGFSKGMKRQAELILALASKTEIILLDESFDGLDPSKRVLVEKILLDYMAENNATVIISSHNLHELANICDKIALINGQNISMVCSVDDESSSRAKFRLIFTEDKIEKDFSEIKYKNFSKDGKIISFTVSENIEDAQRKIEAMNPIMFDKIPLTIEEIFLEEMEDNNYDFDKIFS